MYQRPNYLHQSYTPRDVSPVATDERA